MRLKTWDILAIIFFLAAIAAVLFYALIFSDPYTSLNPFPPPTVPALLVLPTSTSTPVRMATTWTPLPGSGGLTTPTLALSSTPLPTSTGFVLPSATDTLPATSTRTATPTQTLTPTRTVTPSQTRVPTRTRTPTQTLLPTDTETPTPTVTPTL